MGHLRVYLSASGLSRLHSRALLCHLQEDGKKSYRMTCLPQLHSRALLCHFQKDGKKRYQMTSLSRLHSRTLLCHLQEDGKKSYQMTASQWLVYPDYTHGPSLNHLQEDGKKSYRIDASQWLVYPNYSHRPCYVISKKTVRKAIEWLLVNDLCTLMGLATSSPGRW